MDGDRGGLGGQDGRGKGADHEHYQYQHRRYPQNSAQRHPVLLPIVNQNQDGYKCIRTEFYVFRLDEQAWGPRG